MKLKDLNPHDYELCPMRALNLGVLAAALTILEDVRKEKFIVTSGLRILSDQEKINPNVKDSAHLTGQAVDVSDPDKKVWEFLIDNLDLVSKLGLYLENKSFTPKHVHLTMRRPPSGNRIFNP